MTAAGRKRAADAFKIVYGHFVNAQRQVQLGADHCCGPSEARRSDTHDGINAVVDAHPLAQQLRISTAFLPIRIAHDNDGNGRGGSLLLGRKRSSLKKRHSESGEIIGRNDVREHAASGVALRETHHGHVVGHQAGERAAVCAVVREKFSVVRI